MGCFGLSQRTGERELLNVFERYGPVEKVMLIIDRKTQISKGYAFIYFENGNDAGNAKEACAGIELDGRPIRVDFSLTKRPHSPTPGTYLGRRYQGGPNKSSYGGSYNNGGNSGSYNGGGGGGRFGSGSGGGGGSYNNDNNNSYKSYNDNNNDTNGRYNADNYNKRGSSRNRNGMSGGNKHRSRSRSKSHSRSRSRSYSRSNSRSPSR